MIATSDAHRLHAFGRHYTSMPMPSALTIEKTFLADCAAARCANKSSFELTDFLSAI